MMPNYDKFVKVINFELSDGVLVDLLSSKKNF